MTVHELADKCSFKILNMPEDGKREVTKPYCCDLLSIAMGRTPEGSAWVTVMANINTLAVAALTDCACVIFAEGIMPEKQLVEKAVEQDIALLSTELPVFEAALAVWKQLGL